MSYQHFSSMGSDPIDGEAAATARGMGNVV